MIRVWEPSSGDPPPATWNRWLAQGETLLWAAEVPERVRAPEYRRRALMFLALFALTLPFVPFGESSAAYCLRHPGDKCGTIWVLLWLLAGVVAFEVLRNAWLWRRAPRSGAMLHYALTDRRALLDDPNPDRPAQALMLRGTRAGPAFFGDGVVFGPPRRPAMQFRGLDEAVSQRALAIAWQAGARG